MSSSCTCMHACSFWGLLPFPVLSESSEVMTCHTAHHWLSRKGEPGLPAFNSLWWVLGKAAFYEDLITVLLRKTGLSLNSSFPCCIISSQTASWEVGHTISRHCQNEVREPGILLPVCQRRRRRNSHGQEPKIEAAKIGQETACPVLAILCSPPFPLPFTPLQK